MMRKGLVSLGAIVVIIAAYSINFYNGLVGRTQAIDNQWAQVETQYQRRFDLIPNLVNSVKGSFTQEQAVFGQIAEARTRYAGAATVDEKARAAGELEGLLSRLLVIVESYPELRSQENVTVLMDDLAGTENRIAVERRRFNDLVRDYNTTIKRIPGKFIASVFGFSRRSFFEAVPGAERAPEVDLSVPKDTGQGAGTPVVPSPTAGSLGSPSGGVRVECDAQTQCPQGKECWGLPGEDLPKCVVPGDLCQQYCDAEKEDDCLTLNTYPPRLVCPQ